MKRNSWNCLPLGRYVRAYVEAVTNRRVFAGMDDVYITKLFGYLLPIVLLFSFVSRACPDQVVLSWWCLARCHVLDLWEVWWHCYYGIYPGWYS